MNKALKVMIVAAGLVAVFLTLAIGVPTLLANDSAPKGPPPQAVIKDGGIVQQVASILNITTENLTQAMKQAVVSFNGTKPTDDAFYGKVAEILGIDKATLEDAVKKASAAILDKKVAAILDQAVTKGTITKDEKAQIETWFSQRPSALENLFNFDKLHGLMGWGRAEKNIEKLPNTNHGKAPQGNNGKANVKPPKATPKTTPTPTINATSLRLY